VLTSPAAILFVEEGESFKQTQRVVPVFLHDFGMYLGESLVHEVEDCIIIEVLPIALLYFQ
jgi:hypothetical protein